MRATPRYIGIRRQIEFLSKRRLFSRQNTRRHDLRHVSTKQFSCGRKTELLLCATFEVTLGKNIRRRKKEKLFKTTNEDHKRVAMYTSQAETVGFSGTVACHLWRERRNCCTTGPTRNQLFHSRSNARSHVYALGPRICGNPAFKSLPTEEPWAANGKATHGRTVEWRRSVAEIKKIEFIQGQ